MRSVAAATLASLSVACAPLAPSPYGEIVVDIRHSRFSPAHFTLEAGSRVRFVVRNTDFIDHEFILGDASVHARHERGADGSHGTVPGEVSVPAHTTGVTVFTFKMAGTVLFACHLPGHLAYGMTGTVTAVSRSSG